MRWREDDGSLHIVVCGIALPGNENLYDSTSTLRRRVTNAASSRAGPPNPLGIMLKRNCAAMPPTPISCRAGAVLDGEARGESLACSFRRCVAFLPAGNVSRRDRKSPWRYFTSIERRERRALQGMYAMCARRNKVFRRRLPAARGKLSWRQFDKHHAL